MIQSLSFDEAVHPELPTFFINRKSGYGAIFSKFINL